MAEKVRYFPKPDPLSVVQISENDAERLARRRKALEILREQARIADRRLKLDMFNIWRTGGGTIHQVSEAAGYHPIWISDVFEKIKKDPKLLEEAINEWIADNPGKTLNGKLDDK